MAPLQDVPIAHGKVVLCHCCCRQRRRFGRCTVERGRKRPEVVSVAESVGRRSTVQVGWRVQRYESERRPVVAGEKQLVTLVRRSRRVRHNGRGIS
eukprot:scaffold97529_cov15-Prasinocladus_malaysianus.AAC.1